MVDKRDKKRTENVLGVWWNKIKYINETNKTKIAKKK